jgi:uncharacterized Zn-binding protein involved in type VI secretion
MPPAARISDQTAHGGIVTVGFPTVLICNLPAARVGDLHTCPMVTGVVPHVGGPLITGSFTVLVGGMPQAKVGDMLVCVGPPDTLIMGAPTVQVGMAGGGGGGFGSAMAGLTALGGQPRALEANHSPTSEMQTDHSITTRYNEQITIEGPLRYQALVVHALRLFLAKPAGQDWQQKQIASDRCVRICPAACRSIARADRETFVPFDPPELSESADWGDAMGSELMRATPAAGPGLPGDSLAA